MDRGPLWWPHVQAWTIGTFAIVIIAGVAGRIIAGTKQYDWPRLSVPAPVLVAALSLFLFASATFAMVDVFSSNPHLVDEIAQLFHARIYSAGRLAAPAPEFPEFFLFMNSFIADQGWLSQYPPGHPAILGIGLLLGLEWLVNPLLAGASVCLIYLLTRELFGPKTALISSFLWATSGWVIFMSGTYQSHVSAAFFALLAWVMVLGRAGPSAWRGVLCGVALGMLGAVRPLDAVAASVPIIAWMAVYRQWRTSPWLLVGAAPLGVMVALVNWRTFGHPLTFGYTALYGSEHGLGFHTDPYGWAFTPLDALRNAFYAIRRVNIYLFEWPIPSLLPVGVWAFFASQKRPAELIVAIGVLSLPVCYLFYWHSGFYIGPRFYYGLTPFLAIGTALAWQWAIETAKRTKVTWFRVDMALRWAAVAVLAWGFLGLLPARARAYAQQMPTAKLHPERILEERGVQRAVVLVPDSWLSRTVSGLWAIGAPAGLVERAVGKLDTCDLDGLLRHARDLQWPPEVVSDSLRMLLANTTKVVPQARELPDPTTRLRRSADLPARCMKELARDYDGFTLYGQFAWRNPIRLADGIIFARDLYEENSRLLANYDNWDVWRYAPPPGDPAGEPILTRLRSSDVTGVAEE